MKVTTALVGPREVELTIEPDAEFLERAMRQAAQRISRYRPVRGYRPGRAPYALVERIYGREIILNEALEHEAQTIYEQAIREAAIEPLTREQMSIASQDPVTLKVRVSLVPEVTLGDYKSITLEPKPPVSISEEELDRALQDIRRRHAEVTTVERPLAMGDQARMNIIGEVEGERVINLTEYVQDITAEMTPPGFAEAILGMSAGETREFTLSYPEDYEDQKLAGKQVAFTVTLLSVSEVKLPPLDDELAKLEGEFETLEALRSHLAEEMKAERERAQRAQEIEEAVERLIEISQFDYPDVMLRDELDRLINERRVMAESLGYSFENYLRLMGTNEPKLREELNPQAMRNIARDLVLSELAKAEGLTLTEKEQNDALNAWYFRLLMTYGTQERAQEAAREMLRRGAMVRILSRALSEKAATYLALLATGRHEEAAKLKVAQEPSQEPQEGDAAEGKAPEVAPQAPSSGEAETSSEPSEV